MAKLRAHFPNDRRKDEDFKLVVPDYLAVLAQYDAPIIEGAIAAWINTEKTFPKIAELRATLDRTTGAKATANPVPVEKPWKPNPDDFGPDFCARMEDEIGTMDPSPVRNSLVNLLAACRIGSMREREKQRRGDR